MEPLYNVNGLMFWTEREIRLRRQFEEHFAFTMEQILLAENSAWKFIQVEAPILTPRTEINPNYTNDDIWVQQAEEEILVDEDTRGVPYSYREDSDLVLRPETTPGSYTYACHLLNSHSGVKPPFVVWQTGKSFRREQDQVTKNMRLKEFYQQEFQCIYTADTMNDYHAAVLEPVRKMLGEMIGLPTRIVESDRLPSYSETTMDVECNLVDLPDHCLDMSRFPMESHWMEICSVSRRTDFPQKARFQTKKKIVEKDLLVLEISIGLDRCVYNFEQRRD